MYFFPEATARAALRAGMRAALGVIALEFPSAYAADAHGYLAQGPRDARRLSRRAAAHVLPRAARALHGGRRDAASASRVLAEELDVPIHMHVHETARRDRARASPSTACGPLERLRRLGLVGPRLIAVHAVHLDEDELDLLAREGVSVAHCPSSNLKLASGIAPVAAMRARGISVGVGTDGAASNNRLDVMTEMRTAALLAKGATRRCDARWPRSRRSRWPRSTARAPSGLDGEIGSIVPGKCGGPRRRGTLARSRRCPASIRSRTSSTPRGAST